MLFLRDRLNRKGTMVSLCFKCRQSSGQKKRAFQITLHVYPNLYHRLTQIKFHADATWFVSAFYPLVHLLMRVRSSLGISSAAILLAGMISVTSKLENEKGNCELKLELACKQELN